MLAAFRAHLLHLPAILPTAQLAALASAPRVYWILYFRNVQTIYTLYYDLKPSSHSFHAPSKSKAMPSTCFVMLRQAPLAFCVSASSAAPCREQQLWDRQQALLDRMQQQWDSERQVSSVANAHHAQRTAWQRKYC
jgi:hypothetical protein